MRPDNSWQARTEGAFDLSYFTVDWENQKVVCPQGKDTVYWKETKRDGYDKILAKFHQSDCQVCKKQRTTSSYRRAQNQCTKSRAGHRELTFPPQEEYLALQSIRQFQTTEDFKERYAKRAGISAGVAVSNFPEGTISQATYALNMRRARYRGVVKTHLQHVLTSCAINLKRVVNWLNEKPRSTTRKSRFAALAA